MYTFANNNIKKIHTLNFYPLCHSFNQFSGEWPIYRQKNKALCDSCDSALCDCTMQEGLHMESCRESITKSKHVLYWKPFTPNYCLPGWLDWFLQNIKYIIFLYFMLSCTWHTFWTTREDTHTHTQNTSSLSLTHTQMLKTLPSPPLLSLCAVEAELECPFS